MALLVPSFGAAQATHVRALRADVAAVYTIWDADDVCSQPVQPKECKLDVSCSACLTRSGCAVESTTGKCVSASRINTTISNISVEYFLSGQTQYCDASDDACSSCGADATASNAVCRGTGDCVCVRQCELAAAHASKCESSGETFSMYYLIIAVALLAPALIMKRMYKGLTSGLPMNSSDRRMMREAARDANPLTMKLDGWRGFIEKEHQDQSEKIEIKLCPTRSSEDGIGSNDEGLRRNDHSAASTEDDENENKPDKTEYALATTPKSSESRELTE